MLLKISLSFLLLLQAPSLGTKDLPRGLRTFLEKMRESKKNIPAGTMFDPDTATSTPRNDESSPLQELRDYPEYSGGVNITAIDTTPRYLPPAFCLPRPTAVEIPKGRNYLRFPSFVILNRCTGGCFAQGSHHCTVKEVTEISVQFNLFLPGRPAMTTTAKMYDHTGCICDCIKNASHCDLAKHKWDIDSCSCKCKSDGSKCDTSIHRWNKATCECDCKEAPSPCNDFEHEWDKTRCTCYCKQSLQDECKTKKQDIDPKTCQCISPGVQVVN